MSTKTLITYLGGTGGDFITQCCNNPESLEFKKNTVANKTFTIKPKEEYLKNNLDLLIQYIEQFSVAFLSTHLYRSINKLPYQKISLIVNNNQMYETFIFRQLYLQSHKLNRSDDNSLSVFSVIQAYKKQNNIKKSAEILFNFLSSRWIKNMNFRKSNPLTDSTVVDVSDIFSLSSIDNLLVQLPIPFSKYNLIKKIHSQWVTSQPILNKDIVINKMIEKISLMNFDSTSECVRYSF